MILTPIILNQNPSHVLWQIGQTDGKPSEFGLAPGGYSHYGDDPAYVVGTSTPRDWPYVLPGPSDNWAFNRPHRADVYFGLAAVDPNATCRLTVDFADTHPNSPPKLKLLVNGKFVSAWQAPHGENDEVVLGHATTGKVAHWTAEIPARLLRSGNNVLEIVNDDMSWVVFDAVRLDGPESMRIVPVKPDVEINYLPPRQAIFRTPAGPRQPLRFEVTNLGEPVSARFSVAGQSTQNMDLKRGRQVVELSIPPVKRAEEVPVRLSYGGHETERRFMLQPVRPWTVYLFPHSHVDIGYTSLQSEVLALHERNFRDAMQVAKESASNPPDSRFHFHTEATWVLDRYLQTATPEQKAQVTMGLRNGTLGVSAGYANLLTGAMHPEELMQSYRYSRILQDKLGVTFDTVSQSDVPGVTWGDVVALNEAGIKNLVLMPNAFDRVGGVHRAWQDKPFYWVAPSGREKVLVWQTDPYSVGVMSWWDGDRGHMIRTKNPSDRFIEPYIFPKLDLLLQRKYPYDIVAVPWSVTDNAPIDADVPAAAKAWNDKYVYPHVVVSNLSTACKALTDRYDKQIPRVRGDYSPYWEDGTGSSAKETAMNRASANRLVQAETLSAVKGVPYAANAFLEAWRNVVLYSEHTWGAYNSISEPDSDFVKKQWAVKQGFALKADEMSKDLLRRELGSPGEVFSVYNTNCWPRTGLVRLNAQRGDLAVDSTGHPLPSQRLRSGELVVLVKNVPPLGSVQIQVKPGKAYAGTEQATASGDGLQNAYYQVGLSRTTGAIRSLMSWRQGKEMVTPGTKFGLNQFLYLPGSDVKGLQTDRSAKIEVVEPGPLVATVRITSDAPGATALRQEITLVAGEDAVDLRNEIDKLPVRSKEGVHFAFPFNVPNGQMRIDMPWALVRPEKDQIAGANKNWLVTEGYVDVSKPGFGITCSSIDAPLVEVGSLTANVIGSATRADEWVSHLPPTSTFYSWALNNHWHTNYLAEQAGTLVFRYRLQAHGDFQSANASRFGMESRQPLLVAKAAPSVAPLLTLDNPSVLVTRLAPSDDGKAIIVRLWAPTVQAQQVRLKWRPGAIRSVTRTDLSQKRGGRVKDTVTLPGWTVMTLRAEKN